MITGSDLTLVTSIFASNALDSVLRLLLASCFSSKGYTTSYLLWGYTYIAGSRKR